MLSFIRKQFDENKIDALLVSNSTNIFFLSKFRGSFGSVLITKNHAYLLTDQRYVEKANKSVGSEFRVMDISSEPFLNLHNLLIKHRVKYLGVESKYLSCFMCEKINSLNGIHVKHTDGVIESVRVVKDKETLKQIRQSQRFNEQVLKMVLADIKLGITEAQIVWKIKSYAYSLGADGVCFEPIAAFGANSAFPHHEASKRKKLKRGDVVLIDMGLLVGHCASDMTRTFFTKVPTSQQEHAYRTVLQAMKLAKQAIRPGVTGDDVDKAARMYISHNGFKKRFIHATGHGVGYDVQEKPILAKASRDELKKGSVVTIEPGIYIPGKFGVRVEDMVEVGQKGAVVLSKFPKNLDDIIIKV